MPQFTPIDPKQNFAQQEEKIIKFWKEHKIFEKSVDNRPESDPYRFYDWPPFITWTPHYWHLLASAIKDAVPRFRTMKWKRCERVRWRDCHGIAVEEKVMKRLNIESNSAIEDFGIDKFIQECYNYTAEVSSERDRYIDRIWRRVDLKWAYKTMDQSYMESVMRTFKQFYEKWLVYKWKRISLYSVKLWTPISNFEVAMDNSYESVNDPAITVSFDLSSNGWKREWVSALAWTTTPWSLPSNLALAVNSQLKYCLIKNWNNKFVLALARLEDVMKWKWDFEIIEEFDWSELVWLSYEPVFDFYKNLATDKDFKIYDADFITDTDWTGIWHQAPEFWEVDFQLWKENWLLQTESIDDECKYSSQIPDYRWRYIKDCQEDIMDRLKEEWKLFKKESITHRVAVCPRTQIPLVYRTQDSRFLDIQSIKDKLLEQNEDINRFPDHVKYGRFHKNIESAPDRCLSRKRYRATPMPMWICENDSCKHSHVIWSKQELSQLSWKEVPDLHRPYIDEITFPCPKCWSTMKRVPEVLDVWLESGSMSLSQFHYPFENKEKFEKAYPADFIVEYVWQIRARFYVMHVVGVALFGKNAYKNVITTWIIAGNDGRKMSKSYGNFTDPKDLIDKYWWDAIRYYMLSSSLVKWWDMNFLDEWVLDVVKKLLLPIRNTLSFFTTYANIDNYDPSHIFIAWKLDEWYFNKNKVQNVLDKWLLSELNKLIKDFDESMADYDLQKATKYILDFVENLSNRYIRRSRRRFRKTENDNDKMQAYDTLFFTLIQFSQVLAPICPFMAERVYQVLTDDVSVHLTDFPQYNPLLIDEKLSQEMRKAKDLVGLWLSLRAKNDIRVRQPLASITIWETLDDYYIQIIQEELNIKQVIQWYDMWKLATRIAMPDAKILWPKYWKSVQEIIKLAKSWDFEELEDGKIKVWNFVLGDNEFEITYRDNWTDLNIEWWYWTVLAMDLNITQELKNEWFARDLVRIIQEARKEAGYNVDDRISISIDLPSDSTLAISTFQDYIQSETLSTIKDSLAKSDIEKEFDLDWIKGKVGLVR